MQRTIAEKFISHRNILELNYSSKDYFLIPLGVIKEKANEAPRSYMSIFESIDDYHSGIEDVYKRQESTSKHFSKTQKNAVTLPIKLKV